MTEHFDLSLVLTHACNLACRYCYMGDHHSTWMDEALGRDAIRLAMDRSPSVHLAFFGGEPLLAWDSLVRLAEHARSKATGARTLTMQVTTNGTLVDDARAVRLKELEIEVAVSLDGGPDVQDAGRPKKGGGPSFDDAVAGARTLQRAGVPFDIVAVTTPTNAGRLDESIARLSELGPRRIFLNPAFDSEWSDENLQAWEGALRRTADMIRVSSERGRALFVDAFESKLASAVKGERTKHCSAGRTNVAVAPSGNLYPCDRLVGEDRDPRFRIGHITQGFDALPSLKRGPADSECFECEELPRCRGSCACANIAESGQPEIPGGVQCWYERVLATIVQDLGWELALGDASFRERAYGDLADAVVGSIPRKLPVVR